MKVRMSGEINIRLLNPSIALEYLTFKKAYQGKNFIDIRENVIPRYFSAYDFCLHINTLREKRIEIANMGKEQAKKAFDMAFDDLLRNKIKDTGIDPEGFRQLVGTLMSVYKSPKFKEFTENYTQDIFYVLDQITKEKTDKELKNQQKTEKRAQKEGKLKEKEQTKVENEFLIHKELFEIYIARQNDFLNSREVGYTLSIEDKQTIFADAWKEFSEKNSLSKKESQRIYNEFYQNFIY